MEISSAPFPPVPDAMRNDVLVCRRLSCPLRRNDGHVEHHPVYKVSAAGQELTLELTLPNKQVASAAAALNVDRRGSPDARNASTHLTEATTMEITTESLMLTAC